MALPVRWIPVELRNASHPVGSGVSIIGSDSVSLSKSLSNFEFVSYFEVLDLRLALVRSLLLSGSRSHFG